MAWFVPILIFLARICDVSIGTTRMIFVINGHRWIAAILGFFEVLIWVLAVGGVVNHLNEWTAVFGWASGFAVGTMVGMVIEDRIAMGYRTLRVINADHRIDVSNALRERGYRVTRVEGTGLKGPVELAFMVVRRRHAPEALRNIHGIAPEAFVTVERTDRAAGSTFKTARNGRAGLWMRAAAVRK